MQRPGWLQTNMIYLTHGRANIDNFDHGNKAEWPVPSQAFPLATVNASENRITAITLRLLLLLPECRVHLQQDDHLGQWIAEEQ